MSGTNLSWEPKPIVQPNFFTKNVALRRALVATFGNLPITLDSGDVEKLEVMINCGFADASQIVKSIFEFGRIEIKEHF